MFKIYDKVKIKKNGFTGTVIDISECNGDKIFIVESNIKGKRTDGYIEHSIKGDFYPLYKGKPVCWHYSGDYVYAFENHGFYKYNFFDRN